MSHIKIDKQKATNKWSPVLENMGVRDAEKLDWMSELAELTQIHENAYINQGTTVGMGNVISSQPSLYAGQTIGGYATGDVYGSGGAIGSGDYGQNLLPVAMKIAGQTIGLDLVSVKPAAGPKIDLMYVDFQYDNTEDTADSTTRPQVMKVAYADSDLAAVTVYLNSLMTKAGAFETVGGLTKRMYVKFNTANTITSADLTTVPTTKTEWVEFLGFSRVDLLPMFRVFKQAANISATSAYASWSFDATKNTFPQTGAMVTTINTGFAAVTGGVGGTVSALAIVATASTKVEMISTLEDHIPGFVSNFFGGSKQADYGMTRGQEENQYPNIIAPQVFSKSIQVGTIEVASVLKRTEMEDIKSNLGIDILQKMESILVNELSQTISKQIVNKLFEMGDLNRASAPANVTTNITDGKIFDFDVTAYLATNAPGGETSHAIQRKLISKIMNASNFIATEGRVGPAQFVVTNGKFAAVLQDIAGYSINPKSSKMNGSGQLYPVGTIGDVQIYVDPYMKYSDNRVLVGRKNKPDEPGIVFIPYLMAQSISLMTEATGSPKIILRSRYAVGELGFYPQKQYMTLKIYDANNVMM